MWKYNNRKWVEKNDESIRTYNVDIKIKFKTLSSYFDYVFVNALYNNWQRADEATGNSNIKC